VNNTTKYNGAVKNGSLKSGGVWFASVLVLVSAWCTYKYIYTYRERQRERAIGQRKVTSTKQEWKKQNATTKQCTYTQKGRELINQVKRNASLHTYGKFVVTVFGFYITLLKIK